MLYKTLILPIIDYADIIYDGMSQKNSMALQRVQNMAFKSILKVPKLTATTQIHADLDMLTLNQRRTMHTATQMYKIHTHDCPHYVEWLFECRGDQSNHCTRAAVIGDFTIPRLRLEQSKRCFTYRGSVTWDGLPLWLKLSPDVTQFKANIKQWLLDGDNDVTWIAVK